MGHQLLKRAAILLCLLTTLAFGQTGPHRKVFPGGGGPCVDSPAYVTSSIVSFSVNVSTPIGGGTFTGSHTVSYTLGSGDTLLAGLIPDQVSLYSISDTGGNSWVIPGLQYAMNVGYTQSGNVTSQITFTFQATSAITATATIILGEYHLGPLNDLGNVSPAQTPPYTTMIVNPSTSPISGVYVQEGYIGDRVWIGFAAADNGFHNPGINFTGPSGTYGGTQRQVINEYSYAGAPLISSFALVDNMGGSTGLSEIGDGPFSEAAWSAYFQLCH